MQNTRINQFLSVRFPKKNVFDDWKKVCTKINTWEIQISNENGWQINMVRHMFQVNTSKNKWWISVTGVSHVHPFFLWTVDLGDPCVDGIKDFNSKKLDM